MRTLISAAGDPEWLPSTIVQSSAALVAIVGGLLVARLVGMASDRGVLLQRLRQLDDQIESTRDQLIDLVKRRVGWDLADFLESAARLYYREGLRTAEELAARVSDGADDERPQFARTFLSYVAKTEPVIRQRYDSGDIASVEDLRRSGVEVEPIFEPVVDEMLKSFTPRRPTTFGWEIGSLMPPVPVDQASRTVTLQRWEALLGDIDAMEVRIKDLERARAMAADDLGALKPRAVSAALIALAGVVIAGIAFPVVVLAMRWPDITPPWRWALVSAFLVSVTGVGIYIQFLARSLTGAGPLAKKVHAPSGSDDAVIKAVIEESTRGSDEPAVETASSPTL